jgi:FKBP-type peptidyl-prolyl cis-trans isomerase SlyD
VETITKNSYVVFNYTLTDDQGRVLSSSEPHGPLDYIHGTGTLIPGLERTMEGKKVGESFNVTVKPEEGYGNRREDLVHVLPREQFGFEGNIEVGMQFQADTPSGAINLTVTNVTDKEVTVDANHPFSGINLNFKVSIVECRPATKEELEGLSNHACNDTNCGGCGGGHGHSGGHGGCGC